MPRTTTVDPGIDRVVRGIAAVDDHAHPIPPEREVPPDPAHPINPYPHTVPLRQRQTNPEYVDAWRALWGYQHDDADDDHLRELIETKRAVQAGKGSGYSTWVLDQVNVETMLGIDHAPRDALPAPRFGWLSFSDWLMWPVPSADRTRLTSGYREQLDQAFLRFGTDTPPATLDDYVHTVLRPELARRRADGAVGLKFHTAYYRPIDFGDVPASLAAELYRRGRERGVLTGAEHRELEDHLFAVIAGTAAELGLPVQMHTGQGARPGFRNLGSNPLLLEDAVLAAPETRFLLLHAGWPFDRQAVASLSHGNVYLDISCATVHLYAHNLAGIVRDALEWYPEKILYGTDAYSDISLATLSGAEPRSNFLQGWEEKAWLLDRTARDALAIALTDMRDDRVIRHDDVERLARMVLHDNAVELYHL